MARISLSLMGAFTRTYLCEGSAISQGSIVKRGTDKEQQAKLTTDDNDKAFGIAVTGHAENNVITVCENGGSIPVTAAKAMTDLDVEVFMSAADPQQVTDTAPVIAGTYYRLGFLKSIADAAGDTVTVFVDIKKIVIS